MNAKDLNQNAQLSQTDMERIAKAAAPRIKANKEKLQKAGLGSLSFW